MLERRVLLAPQDQQVRPETQVLRSNRTTELRVQLDQPERKEKLSYWTARCAGATGATGPTGATVIRVFKDWQVYWSDRSNGATGETGATGSTGATGATGAGAVLKDRGTVVKRTKQLTLLLTKSDLDCTSGEYEC